MKLDKFVIRHQTVFFKIKYLGIFEWIYSILISILLFVFICGENHLQKAGIGLIISLAFFIPLVEFDLFLCDKFATYENKVDLPFKKLKKSLQTDFLNFKNWHVSLSYYCTNFLEIFILFAFPLDLVCDLITSNHKSFLIILLIYFFIFEINHILKKEFELEKAKRYNN